MRHDTKKGPFTVSDSEEGVKFMIFDDFIEDGSHVFAFHFEEHHLCDFLENLVFSIGMAFVSIVDKNAALLKVGLDDDILLFLNVFDGFRQEGGDEFENVAIDLQGEMFIVEIEDGGMFGHVFVEKGEDLVFGVEIGVENGGLNSFVMDFVNGGDLGGFHELTIVCRVFNFLDDLCMVAIEEDEFGFHLKDLIFEETAYFIVLSIKHSQKITVNLQFVVVLCFYLP